MPLTNGAMEQLRLGQGGSYSLARDAIAHRVYDQRAFGTTAVDATYFTQQIGQPWVGATFKTINETNMQDSGKLPNGQTFLINRIGIAAVMLTAHSAAENTNMVGDFYNILSSSVFEITLAGREFDFQAHGRQFLPMPVASSGTLASFARVGDMIASGWCNLNPTPIFLDQLVTFKITQRLGNPIVALQTILNNSATVLNGYSATMMIILDGFLTRAK